VRCRAAEAAPPLGQCLSWVQLATFPSVGAKVRISQERTLGLVVRVDQFEWNW
jgi:hypothetical protein